MKYLLYSGVLAWFAFSTGNAPAQRGNFGDDVKFLAKHVETIILGAGKTGPRVAVVAAYQGRVMTTTRVANRTTVIAEPTSVSRSRQKVTG